MKIVRFLIFVFFISSLASFLFILNLQLAFGSPSKVKTILNNSDAYNSISSVIRENIAKVNPEFDQGNLLEILNDKVSPQNFRLLSEDLIDQFFINPGKDGKKVIVLHYSLLQKDLQGFVLPQDQSYTFSGPVARYTKPGMSLALAGFLTLLWLLLHILLIGNDKKSRLRWLGISFFLVSLFLLIDTALLFLIVPSAMDRLVSMASIENQSIARGLTKAGLAVIDSIKNYYLIELIVSVLFTFVFSIISKVLKSKASEGIDVLKPKESLVSTK